jgi:hypothetical protein
MESTVYIIFSFSPFKGIGGNRGIGGNGENLYNFILPAVVLSVLSP